MAMKHFETFCSTKGLCLNSTGVASAQRLSEEELCSEQLFREFATTVRNNWYCCTVFVCGERNGNEKISAEHSLEERLLERWYPSLRVAVEKKVNRRQIQDGRPIAESSLPLGRKLLTSICEGLMKVTSNSVDSMKRRLAIVMNFFAVGRSGEVACSTWTTAFWDDDFGNLIMEWRELKTGTFILI